MAEVAGHRYRFDIIDYDALGSEDEHRDYWLISLESEQLQDEERWHELFCQKVGTHFDFTERSPLPPDKVCLDAFYIPYQSRTMPDYTSNEVIGWFCL